MFGADGNSEFNNLLLGAHFFHRFANIPLGSDKNSGSYVLNEVLETTLY